MSYTRNCLYCNETFTALVHSKRTCTPDHARLQSLKMARERQVQARLAAKATATCITCSTSISHLRRGSKYCEPCAVKRKLFTNSRTLGGRPSTRGQGKTVKPKATPTQPKTTTARITHEPKPQMVMPNFGGDWYPGWDGPWSPNIPPEGRALIEKWITPYSSKKEHDEEAA